MLWSRSRSSRRRQAFAADFDPSEEFELKPWVSIHLGSLDLSITRAVVYILLGALISCLIGICFMRFEAEHVRRPAAVRSAR